MTEYRHSGRFRLVFAIAAAIGSVGSAFMLGATYGALCLGVDVLAKGIEPFREWKGVIHLLLTPSLGFLVGWTNASVAQWGHIRNGSLVFATATIAGLASLYASWAAWIYLSLTPELQAVASIDMFSPSAILELINHIDQRRGFFFGLVDMHVHTLWSIEALIIVLGAALVSEDWWKDRPYCETCGKWAVKREGVLFIRDLTPAILLEIVASGEMKRLERFVGIPSMGRWLRLDIETCTTCQEVFGLDVEQFEKKLDSNGKPKTESSRAITNSVLTNDKVVALESVARRTRGRWLTTPN